MFYKHKLVEIDGRTQLLHRGSFCGVSRGDWQAYGPGEIEKSLFFWRKACIATIIFSVGVLLVQLVTIWGALIPISIVSVIMFMMTLTRSARALEPYELSLPTREKIGIPFCQKWEENFMEGKFVNWFIRKSDPDSP